MTSKIGLGVISFAHGHANLYCQRLATYDDVQLVAAWDDDSAHGGARPPSSMACATRPTWRICSTIPPSRA